MVFETVKNVIVETVNCEEALVTMEAGLKDTLGLDSLDAVEVSMALEEEFAITIAEDAMGKFVTVGDIVAYIEGLQ